MRKATFFSAASLVGFAAVVGCNDPTVLKDVAKIPSDTTHVVTFGDDNVDIGYSDALSKYVAYSYVSGDSGRLPANAPNHPMQMAGVIEARWKLLTNNQPIRVVNHGISGTGSTATLALNGMPNARYEIGGVTRFEGEVLGVKVNGLPWTFNGIPRVNAFVPGPHDFVYVAFGANDCKEGVDLADTRANIEWLFGKWIAAGLPSRHFVLSTLPPTPYAPACDTKAFNVGLRKYAEINKISMVDVAARTFDADTVTWANPTVLIDGPNGFRFKEKMRTWIAARVAGAMLEARAMD